MRLIARGAEAEIIIDEKNHIHKKRTRKTYRHPELDKTLRTERTKKEANILEKARTKGISVPKIIKKEEHTIILENIKGEKISTIGTIIPLEIARQLGETIANMHDENIIHGDLTTSNMILQEDNICLIDFGLGFTSTRTEDKAVDLHVLEEALEARHPTNSEKFFKEFCEEYKKKSKIGAEVIKRLEKVQARGRNKIQV